VNYPEIILQEDAIRIRSDLKEYYYR